MDLYGFIGGVNGGFTHQQHLAMDCQREQTRTNHGILGHKKQGM